MLSVLQGVPTTHTCRGCQQLAAIRKQVALPMFAMPSGSAYGGVCLNVWHTVAAAHNLDPSALTCTAASRCCILRKNLLWSEMLLRTSAGCALTACSLAAAGAVPDVTMTACVAADTLPARLFTADCRAASRRFRREFSATSRLSCAQHRRGGNSGCC